MTYLDKLPPKMRRSDRIDKKYPTRPPKDKK